MPATKTKHSYTPTSYPPFCFSPLPSVQPPSLVSASSECPRARVDLSRWVLQGLGLYCEALHHASHHSGQSYREVRVRLADGLGVFKSEANRNHKLKKESKTQTYGEITRKVGMKTHRWVLKNKNCQ